MSWKRSRRILALPYIVWMLILIVAPMLLIVYYAFTEPVDARLVFSLENIKDAFDPIYMGILGHSVGLAMMATVICLLLGFPVAYLLSRMPPRRSAILSMFFILPMWMNFLLRTYAWMGVLDNNGLINKLLALFQLGPLPLMYNTPAVVMGMVYNYLPFMILPIYNILQKIPAETIEAAQDLGASKRTVFSRVIFPLSIPGMISGITMVFVPAITTFAISRLLGGSQYMLYGDLIENQFIQINNQHLGSALSLVMMILVVISMMIMRIFDKDGEAGAV